MIHVRGAQEVHGGAPDLANQHARREVAALSLHGGRPFDSFQREPTGVQLVLRILDVGGAHPREGLRRPTMISVRGSSSSRWTFRIPSWALLIKNPLAATAGGPVDGGIPVGGQGLAEALVLGAARLRRPGSASPWLRPPYPQRCRPSHFCPTRSSDVT